MPLVMSRNSPMVPCGAAGIGAGHAVAAPARSCTLTL
jgi:hypothetical protein